MPVSPRRREEVGDVKNLQYKLGWEEIFLEELAKGRSIEKAAVAAGISWTWVYTRRSRSKEFRKRWKEAADKGTELLEYEAIRRAFHGTQKPVFYRGMQCGEVTEYSDRLLMFMLKSRDAKYKDNPTGIVNNNIVKVNATAASLIRDMVQRGEITSPTDVPTSLISSALGDGGHEREVGASTPPTEDQRRIGKGVENTEQ
jgi:hypothetical protein